MDPFRCVRLSPLAKLPKRQSDGAAGYDLYSATESWIWPWSRVLVPLDIKVAIPTGTYGRIAPRSGLALNSCIDVGAGVVDEDYRGSIGVLLVNSSWRPFKITVGMRVAQLILEKIENPEVVEVRSLDATLRGEGGFGSSGDH